MRKKQIILSVEFDGKKISFPVEFEDAKDKAIAKVIASRLIGMVDLYRSKRLNQVDISRGVQDE